MSATRMNELISKVSRQSNELSLAIISTNMHCHISQLMILFLIYSVALKIACDPAKLE